MTDTKKAAPRQECSPKNTQRDYNTEIPISVRDLCAVEVRFAAGGRGALVPTEGSTRSLRRFLKKRGLSPAEIEAQLRAYNVRGGAV